MKNIKTDLLEADVNQDLPTLDELEFGVSNLLDKVNKELEEIMGLDWIVHLDSKENFKRLSKENKEYNKILIDIKKAKARVAGILMRHY